jgi:hypothetical protein
LLLLFLVLLLVVVVLLPLEGGGRWCRWGVGGSTGSGGVARHQAESAGRERRLVAGHDPKLRSRSRLLAPAKVFPILGIHHLSTSTRSSRSSLTLIPSGFDAASASNPSSFRRSPPKPARSNLGGFRLLGSTYVTNRTAAVVAGVGGVRGEEVGHDPAEGRGIARLSSVPPPRSNLAWRRGRRRRRWRKTTKTNPGPRAD